MDEDAPHHLRWPGILARVIAYPLLAVVLYVVSLGPVYYVGGGHSDEVDEVLDAIYSPLKQLVHGTPIEPPLAAWSRWWVSAPGGPKARWSRQ